MSRIKLGVVMDPIETIKIYKDSTFAMLLEAQRRGWELLYMEQQDLLLRGGDPFARMRPLRVKDDKAGWYELGETREAPLGALGLLLMRKDPPVDMDYVYTTHILELAEREGALVVNRPSALRDVNEKLFCAHFPQCTPPTLVSRHMGDLRRFQEEHGEVVVKPLDAFGGQSVFRLGPADPNLNVILETMTWNGRRLTMMQRYIPEISEGDKRILVLFGEPVPYALARIPRPGESRGNLAAGGRGEGRELTDRDRWICAQVAPELRRRGLYFVGLDVIGDYLTEINVTSPTCIRELDAIYGLNIAGDLLDRLETLR